MKKSSYYQRNRIKCLEYGKRYYRLNRKKCLKYAFDYEKSNRLRKLLHNIRQRCNYPKDKKYSYYGGKGIECFLTVEDLIFLWKRDKAYLLSKPSIDRLNNKKNYILENCRFIEMSENIKRVRKE